MGLVQLGRLLRTALRPDYILNEAFRRELLRVHNRGDALALCPTGGELPGQTA